MRSCSISVKVISSILSLKLFHHCKLRITLDQLLRQKFWLKYLRCLLASFLMIILRVIWMIINLAVLQDLLLKLCYAVSLSYLCFSTQSFQLWLVSIKVCFET